METRREGSVNYSPDKLLSGFSRGRIVLWMLAAVAIHVAFIGMTSLGYIRDRWVDPDGAKNRKAAAEAVLKAEKDGDRNVTAFERTPTNGASVATTATNVVPPLVVRPTTTGDEARILEERKTTPVGKRITDVAKTNELPVQPGDVGISIEDTNAH